jgi:hypothetical protein
MLTHQTNLSIATNDNNKVNAIIDGDHPNQRLASSCRHGYRLAGVHDDEWNRVLLLSRWQVGAHLCLGVKPKDGVDVEQLIPVATGPDLPLSTLKG